MQMSWHRYNQLSSSTTSYRRHFFFQLIIGLKLNDIKENILSRIYQWMDNVQCKVSKSWRFLLEFNALRKFSHKRTDTCFLPLRNKPPLFLASSHVSVALQDNPVRPKPSDRSNINTNIPCVRELKRNPRFSYPCPSLLRIFPFLVSSQRCSGLQAGRGRIPSPNPPIPPSPPSILQSQGNTHEDRDSDGRRGAVPSGCRRARCWRTSL